MHALGLAAQAFSPVCVSGRFRGGGLGGQIIGLFLLSLVLGLDPVVLRAVPRDARIKLSYAVGREIGLALFPLGGGDLGLELVGLVEQPLNRSRTEKVF